jgi:hypothetical protein
MDYVTVKLHTDTRRLLRLIAAQTGEQMVQVMDRLCQAEWSKIEGSTKITHDIAHDEDVHTGEKG